MTIKVTYDIGRLHCNEVGPEGLFRQRDPYIWTVFFYVDIFSIDIPNASFVVAHVPRETHTLRSDFPTVETGDDVTIPDSIGRYTMVLDDGNQGRALAGALVLLLEQGGTDGDAIKAGHKALGGAVEAALDGYIFSKLLQDPLPPPNNQEIQALADQIEGDVKDAIKSASDWWDYFDGKDAMVGFGHHFLTFENLMDLAGQGADSEEDLVFHVESQKTVPLQGGALTLIDDFDIFGSVRVTTDPPAFVGGDMRVQGEVYSDAVDHFNQINERIAEMLTKLQGSEPDPRGRIAEEWKHLRDVVRPQAAKGLTRAHKEYVSAHNRAFPELGSYLEEKLARRESRRERLSAKSPVRFLSSANVVAGKALGDAYDEGTD